MQQTFDFVVIAGGSARAVVAARLSEDPTCRVALLEAGDRPPDIELMPIACAAMQKNPLIDWMYTADPGSAGLGLAGHRIAIPRGKMLGGSSGLNYLAYIRGHPGDFDCWTAGGAKVGVTPICFRISSKVKVSCRTRKRRSMLRPTTLAAPLAFRSIAEFACRSRIC